MDRANSEKLKAFGNALRRIRTSQGISQEQLADICDLDRTYIGGIERGERNVSLINILRVSKALRVRPADLFEGFGK